MFSKRLNFARKLGIAAGNPIIEHFKQHQITKKQDGSVVTEADVMAEKLIRMAISRDYPGEAILGEELGGKQVSKGYQWIVDPLDGTTWFTLGVPIFGTLIALLKDGDPVLGVIHFPMTQETLFAAKNEGCWYQTFGYEPQRVRVNPIMDLNQAVVSASGAHSSNLHALPEQTPFNLSQIIKNSATFRFCGDCLQHALVCRGKVHGAIDTIMKPWDSAAIIPCIKEAGGYVSDIKGNTQNLVWEGSLVTSCSKDLHHQIIQTLNTY